jgi:Zn-dependent protease
MKWSWKLGEFRGIGVYVHATFLILIAFVVWAHWSMGHDLLKTLEGVGFILALFACVVLHEFGHALMAAKYGIKTRDITLLPIGGLARLERMPEEPLQELWVALAGPAVNVVIAAALFGWLVLTKELLPLKEIGVTTGPFLERLMLVNVLLVVFNMLPAFPMDGGRVLRAVLATRMDYVKATQIAASIGQAMALLFGLLGFLFNPFLLFIALFVWIGAAQEAGMVEMTSSFAGIPVAAAMVTNFESVGPADPLAHVTGKILAGTQQDFPVLEGEQVVGILTRHDLLVELAKRGPDVPVADVMQTKFETVDAADMLESAFRRLQSCECHTLPVVQRGRLVGLLTMDNLGEFVAIRSALDAAQHRAAG